MTTVAYDGSMLAADRQCDRNGTRASVTKVFQISKDEIAGVAGAVKFLTPYLDWLRGGRKGPAPRLCDDKNECWSTVLVIRNKGRTVEFHCDGSIEEIKERKWAIGSGKEFAMGAMAAGKNALNAVKIAMKLDTGSGVGWDILWAR